MDNDKISANLSRLFDESRIVFWQDVDGEFQEALPSLELGNVSVIKLNDTSALKIKVEVELEQPSTKFLLYATGEKPAPADDWLRDIRHYSQSFAADRSSMILKDLGLAHASMRDHISDRAKFFASRDRVNKVARLVKPDDNETLLDQKIMASILKLDVFDFYTIVASLYDSSPDYTDLDVEPDAWGDFEKYGVAERFWELARVHFGYDEQEPKLRNLLLRLMITDFAKALRKNVPDALNHLVSKGEHAANSVVCMGQWRDNVLRHDSFDALSNEIADAINLGGSITTLEPDDLRDVKTFQLVEKYIASRIRDRIVDMGSSVNADEIHSLSISRKDSYWANAKLNSTDDAPRSTLSHVYDALIHAARLFELRGKYDDGFSYASTADFWKAYSTELYKFDQLYRHFCENADYAESMGWDILKELRSKVEDCYSNWFVANLALKWGEHVEGDLIDNWQIEHIDRQNRFFNAHVQPTLDKGDDRRVFVIISDAFRYEAAQELTEQLNGKYRFAAELTTQLGVLPSYTALGMASLLPHSQITYSDKDVRIDGASTAGIENRKKILSKVNGTAIKADDFMAMKKAEGREFIKDYQVIYIYHNQIDQTADTGNEEKTFQAVRTTIDELASLVGRIVNNLNGNYIAVTADHGFLFQESAPTATDKNAIQDKPAGTVLSKKRYLIGDNLGNSDKAYLGHISQTAGGKDETEFWVPKGANRFHFVGGSRFVHGGAMPQEVCVPLIKVIQKKGKQAERTKVSQVGISILGTNNKITTNKVRFQFIQNEAVSERIKSVTAKIGIYENGEPISDVKSVTFDSTTPQMCDDWKKEVWLTLSSRTFNKNNQYQLILRNAVDNTEITRQDVTIDLAFSNDFDF
jgi:uncharacterized protein (TIGR02687 family)